MAKEKSAALSMIGLGLGIGICLGFALLIVGWASMFGWGHDFVQAMSSLYVGYENSFIGGIIGGIWDFISGVMEEHSYHEG